MSADSRPTADQALTQQAICECFNQCFGETHRVELRGGGAEPDYVPPTPERGGLLIAREDFAASALHEAAHWCVAGKQRRTQPDYGYIYDPPPRGDTGQQRFFANELRNQATELYLAERAGVYFVASADDPDFCLLALCHFERQVRELVRRWNAADCPEVAPPRARAFGAELAAWHSATHD